jgi:hypothetical protein
MVQVGVVVLNRVVIAAGAKGQQSENDDENAHAYPGSPSEGLSRFSEQ